MGNEQLLSLFLTLNSPTRMLPRIVVSMPESLPEPPEKPLRPAQQLPTLGIEYALFTIVLGLLGWWLDGLCGWREQFPVFLVLGILIAFAWFIWHVKRLLGSGKPPSK
jgi:hypothetical protein